MPEKHILHIEDNFHNRRIVRKILEKQGYLLHEAADGVIGFNMIRDMAPPLVLLDISLPSMDGIEIVKMVKADETLKHIIVIAVTASAMQGDRERFLAAGCDDYLSKPFRSIDLLDLVNQYYDQIPESYMTSFKPKDVIHPIEEHSVLGGSESGERTIQSREETTEASAPTKADAPPEEERRFFSKEDKTIKAEEGSEAIESLQDSELHKTASLQEVFGEDESSGEVRDESAVVEKTGEFEDSLNPPPGKEFARDAEIKRVDDDDATWVMPRNLGGSIETKTLGGIEAKDTTPDRFEVKEEEKLATAEDTPTEEPIPEAVETQEDTWASDTASLQGVFTEEELDELDNIEEDLKEKTSEAEESDEVEGDETLIWGTTAKADTLEEETDFQQESTQEQAPVTTRIEESPEPAEHTEVIDRFMNFSDEETATGTMPTTDEEQTEITDSFEEMAAGDVKAEDVLATEQTPETEEIEIPKETASVSGIDKTSPLHEEVLASSKKEELLSEGPSNGPYEDQSKKEEEMENRQQEVITDKVIRMINRDMIRPVDPNVGLEGA
ncbi:MAG: response regulator [Anaerolineales bacterium]|jgi:CheY-like chemotaxis protein